MLSNNKHKKSVVSKQRTRTTGNDCFQHVFSIYYFTLLLIAFNCCIKHIDAFNLENRLPIVKYGEPNSYFGYSVASHVTGDGDDPDNEENW